MNYNAMIQDEYPDRPGCLRVVIFVVVGLIALAIFGCTKTDIQPDTNLDITPAIIGPTLKSTGPNRMPNGGGENTTDWLGTNIARGWSRPAYDRLSRFSIGQSGGDRHQEASSPSQFVLISPTPTPKDGVWHRLTLRYTSTNPFIVVVRYSDRCGYRVYEGSVNHEWEEVDVTFWAQKVVSVMFYNRPNEPGGVRVDNVNLY